jgi:hypothetical protein
VVCKDNRQNLYSSNNGSNWSNVYNAPSGLYFHMKRRDNTSIWAVRSEEESLNIQRLPQDNYFHYLENRCIKERCKRLVSLGYWDHLEGK